MSFNSTFPAPARAFVLVASISTLSFAQPSMSRITITHVRPDMLSEWVDLQKNEVVPALKKAGQKTRTVYASGLFGNAYEYVTLTPMESFAEFDGQNPVTKALGAPASARLGEKLRKCTVSAQSFQSTLLTDLSNPGPGSEPAAIIVTARVRIAAGKTQEFDNLVKTEVLPIYKKAKVGYQVRRRGLGTNPDDVTLSTEYAKYADLDGGNPIVKTLGPEGAAKLLAKFTGVATLIETVVRNRVADLSF